MTLVKAIGIAASLLVAFAAIGADETAPVPRPEVKVGDTWIYQFVNVVANVPKPLRVESRATFVSGDAIVTVDLLGDGRENDSQFTAEWNAMSLSSGQVYDRPQRVYKFPITVGETYPYLWETSFRGSPARSRSEGMVKVVGWEDVVVPAGKIRAVKIELRGAYQRLDTRYGAPQRWDLWYAPEVKRFVKSLYEDGLPGRIPDTKRLFELLEFKVQ